MVRDGVELRRGSWRLAMQFGALIVVLFIILGGVVFAVVSTSLSESIQRTLINSSLVDSPRDAPTGVFVIFTDDRGTQASPDLPPGLPDTRALRAVSNTGREMQETKILDNHAYTVRTSTDHGRLTQVAVDLHESQEETQRLGAALVVSGIIAAVAAGLIAAWMARRAMRPLTEALAMQRRFVMDASHELRTPLTLLSTRAQLLRRSLTATPASTASTETSADVTDGLEEIVQDARMLSEILEDLLVAADPREVAEKDPLDLAKLASDAVDMLRSDAESRNLVIRRTGSTVPVLVTAARVSMQRLFTALISNALDHAVSQVDVEVTVLHRKAVIRVIDDGPGFPQGIDQHAFERFASSRPASQHPEQPRHYGLGLALVSEVALRHGGGVRIEARGADGGTAVVVRIPTHP